MLRRTTPKPDVPALESAASSSSKPGGHRPRSRGLLRTVSFGNWADQTTAAMAKGLEDAAVQFASQGCSAPSFLSACAESLPILGVAKPTLIDDSLGHQQRSSFNDVPGLRKSSPRQAIGRTLLLDRALHYVISHSLPIGREQPLLSSAILPFAIYLYCTKDGMSNSDIEVCFNFILQTVAFYLMAYDRDRKFTWPDLSRVIVAMGGMPYEFRAVFGTGYRFIKDDVYLALNDSLKEKIGIFLSSTSPSIIEGILFGNLRERYQSQPFHPSELEKFLIFVDRILMDLNQAQAEDVSILLGEIQASTMSANQPLVPTLPPVECVAIKLLRWNREAFRAPPSQLIRALDLPESPMDISPRLPDNNTATEASLSLHVSPRAPRAMSISPLTSPRPGALSSPHQRGQSSSSSSAASSSTSLSRSVSSFFSPLCPQVNKEKSAGAMSVGKMHRRSISF